MKMKLQFFGSLLLLLALNYATAQDSSVNKFAYLDGMITNGELPQYQFSFIKSDGSVIENSGYFRDGIVPVEAANSETLVALLSLSKPITNLLALKLIDEGYLNLDDPITKYLPYFENVKVQNKSTRTARKILVRDLMLHTAGFAQNAELLGWGEIPDIYKQEKIFGLSCLASGSKVPLAEVVEKVASVPLVSEPGEKFSYSIATDVLGHILEVATKRNFESILLEYLKKPLGLQNLTMQISGADAEIAQLYEPIFKSYPVPGAYQRYKPFGQFEIDVANIGVQPGCISPGSGMIANMGDLVVLAQFLLNDMTLKDGSSFLSERSHNQFYDHQLEVDLGNSPLRRSLAYAGKDGLTIGSLAIRLKSDGDLKDISTHDYYYWSGFSGSGLWIDKRTNTAGILLTQLYPNDKFLIPKLVAHARDKFAN